MKIIVDTNLIFSAILNTNSLIGRLLLKPSTTLKFYSCHQLRLEIDNHIPKILAISGYTQQQFEEIKNLVFQPITFISEEIIPFEYWQNAIPLVREVDMDDIAFVALSLFLGAKLWTGDKKLIIGLQAKGFENIITTEEIANL